MSLPVPKTIQVIRSQAPSRDHICDRRAEGREEQAAGIHQRWHTEATLSLKEQQIKDPLQRFVRQAVSAQYNRPEKRIERDSGQQARAEFVDA